MIATTSDTSRDRSNPGAKVVVVGAGAAGMAASIAAARAGAEVKLVELSSGPGGTVANVLIHTLGGLYDHEQRVLNEGLCAELAQRLFKASSKTRIRRIGKVFCLNVCPGVYQSVVASWLAEETRIERLYSANITQLSLSEDSVVGCEIETKTQAEQVQTTAIVDATGTAEVVRLIDPSYVHDDQQRAAGGLIFRLRGAPPGVLSFPKSVTLVQKLRQTAREMQLPATCQHAWMDQGVYEDEVFVKLFVPLPDNWKEPDQLAAVARQSGEIGQQIIALLRNWPEFADARLTETGLLGVRDGGRIRGEYLLTEQDVRGNRKFDDAACRCCWPIEYWHPSEGLQLEYLSEGGYYEIPARALKVQGMANVWAAGKCLSADHKAQSSARVAGQCWAMGEAVGKYAAGGL